MDMYLHWAQPIAQQFCIKNKPNNLLDSIPSKLLVKHPI